ncbi:MAG: hypothetical protein NTW07_13605 [candidate division Zixibacteria bacterium]|nr:hypothetical protein [candidate division Zixibacteria bacterium]
MAEGDKRSPGGSRINEKERYRYIGFEVFPGTPKDLFKSDTEKEKYVEALKARRQSGDTLRDDCKLLEERVGRGERLILAVASVVILLALFLPWYSAFKVVRNETPAQAGQTSTGTTYQGARANEEIITGQVAHARVQKTYSEVSGLGTFVALGNIGGKVFSSGLGVILSGLLMLVYGLLCLGLPVLNLYTIYGTKGKPDEQALQLKKTLRLNWLPLLLLVVVLLLSLLGGDYGFDAPATFASLGDSYSVATLFNTLSWGVFVAMAASVLVAVKGIEI